MIDIIKEKEYDEFNKVIKQNEYYIVNSKNRKTSDPHRFLVNLGGKINLKRSDKYVALSNLSIYYTWKNIKKSYKNNRFKISALTWNEQFDRAYSVLDIQNYFKYIIKNHEAVRSSNKNICKQNRKQNYP